MHGAKKKKKNIISYYEDSETMLTLLLHEWNRIAANLIPLSMLLNGTNWQNYTAKRTKE
jgi:hypothetical protein